MAILQIFPVDSNQAFGMTADIPVDLNECYAATIAPSQEDPGHLYALVEQDKDYEHIIED